MRIYQVLATFFIIALAQIVSAQSNEVPTIVTDQNRTGDLPFSSSMGTSIEHVDLLMGGLNISIPIYNVPDRGFDDKLIYRWDSNYFLESMRLDGLGRPFWIWTTEINGFWQTNTTSFVDSTPFRIQCTDYQGEGWFTGYDAMIYWDRSGGQHSLAAQDEAGNCAGFQGNSSGPDLTGKGMWATAAGSIGNVLQSNGEVEETKDTNGNSSNALGRTICTQGGTSTQTVYTCLDSNGTQQTYTLNWQTITINTSFNLPAVTELVAAQPVISNIVLPNLRQYVFKYDAFGDITEIDLPTGGAVTYTWAIVSPSHDLYHQTRRAVASRTEWVNGVTNGGVCTSGSSTCSTWQLSSAVSGSTYTTTVTYPAGGSPPVQNQSVFVGSNGAISDAKVYAGSATGTPLREYQMGYATDADPMHDDICWNPNDLAIVQPMPQPVGLRLTDITTILEDGTTQAQKQFDYETFTYTYYPNHCTDHYDNSTSTQYTTSRGNITEIREYDWGAGAHGALIRRTDKTYLHNPGGPNYLTYLASNIVNKVLQSTVYDSTSNTCQGLSQACSQTQYEYDNYVPSVNAMISTSGTAPGHDYTNYSSTFIYRGNVTRVMRWPNTTGSPLTSIYTYDDLGNIRAIQDPAGNTTTYSYLDSWSGSSCPVLSGYNGQAFLTKITDALGHLVNRTYYQCSSLLEAHLDQNDINAGRTGTLYSYDWAGRAMQTQDTHLTSDSSWGKTTNTYNDLPPVTVSTSTTITTSLNKTSVATKDGLDRVIETQLTSDPDGTTEVDTTYDALSRKSTVTNPHRATASSSDGTGTYTYDPLSRITSVAQPDGSQLLTSFSANCTTATDEAGKKRKSCSDGLGRVTAVWEDPSNLNYETDYSYDVLGNLRTVTQEGSDSTKARTRTFIYDAISRLISATNPESGTLTYSYKTSAGTLCAGDPSADCSKTAPSPNQPSGGTATVTTTYTYDAVNRLTKKSYADTYTNNMATPTERFGYDGVTLSGCTIAPPTLTDSNPIYHSTAMCDGSGATSWSHDQMARVLKEQRIIKGLTNQNKPISYTYNLDGSLWTLTYPATGKIITYNVSSAGRPTAAQDIGGNIKYVQNATYAPFGGLTGMVNGTATGFNGINTADSYNDRLQPLQLYVTTATITSATLTQLQSSSCPTVVATIMSRSYNFSVGSSDNGDVQSITNCLDNTRTQSFTYDTLNRIATAQSSGTGSTSWGEQYTIDGWGNLTNISPIAGKNNYEPLNCAPANTNNQLGTCYSYDPAGNLTKNGTITYTYDAAGRLAWSTNGYQYFYDGNGNRVVKCTSASQGASCPTGSTGTLYWRFSGGDTITETDLAGTSLEEYIFFGGKRVARRDVSTHAVHYYFPDHLGSASAVTNATGSSLDENLDYYPYGGIAPTSVDSVRQNYKFTGKERDSESGLDFFGVRYHSSSMGRFMQTDPKTGSAHPVDPQTWNRYSYVTNRPLIYLDQDGREKILAIYVDQPVPGMRTTWVRHEMTVNFGHSFLGVRDTDKHNEVKLGFYPTKTVDVMTHESVSGIVRNNDQHQFNIEKDYKLTDSQYKAMVAALKEDAKNPPDYSLRDFNCTDWVIIMALFAGVDLPSHNGTSPNTAADLGQDLADQGANRTPHTGPSSSSSKSNDPQSTNDMTPLEQLLSDPIDEKSDAGGFGAGISYSRGTPKPQ